VEWVVYAKRPFAGPAAVLAYLSRYTHRVAISNRRLVSLDQRGVTFRWKDNRENGSTRYKTMTLSAQEFMRRFLLHVLPSGFHRIRHSGLLGNAHRKDNLAIARELLQQPSSSREGSREGGSLIFPIADLRGHFLLTERLPANDSSSCTTSYQNEAAAPNAATRLPLFAAIFMRLVSIVRGQCPDCAGAIR
jgi:hypothetical protein